jgi:transposase-like protein
MGKTKKGAGPRQHSAEFKIEIAKRMLAGECSAALAQQHGLARSMMYRWRDAYRKDGAAGLERRVGRPPGSSPPSVRLGEMTEDKLRRRIAELERKVGRQAMENDFFRRVFKRVGELPQAPGRGSNASTPKSDG